ncbi:MAG: alkaline phosphatase family protein, partial [Candidatus Riflebacteria bacterium]|nr:alkaline phosphatase family protein [Candidatus Riflebacteria bacterium]
MTCLIASRPAAGPPGLGPPVDDRSVRTGARSFRMVALASILLAVVQPAVAARRAATPVPEEGILLRKVHALRGVPDLQALIREIRGTHRVQPRLRESLVHLAVVAVAEPAAQRGDSEALSAILRLSLPAQTRAFVSALAAPQTGDTGATACAVGAPARGAVIFGVDGLRKDLLDSMLDRGLLPNVGRHLVRRGLSVDRVVTVFPTVTPPAVASMLTGVLPDRHLIPALAWYNPVRGDARLYTSVRGRDINRDLPRSVKTLWELIGHGKETA